MATRRATTLSTAKREIIADTVDQVRKFRFCGPSDDPDKQTAVTAGYRHLVIQLQRLAGPILSEDPASRLNAIDVEIDDLYSAYDGKYPPAEPGALFGEPLKAAIRGR